MPMASQHPATPETGGVTRLADTTGPQRRPGHGPCGVAYLVSTRSYGGPERQIVGAACKLDPGQFRPLIVTFICLRDERRPLLEEAAAAGLPTATVRMTATFDPRGVWGLLKVLRDHGIGLVNTRGYKADLLGLIGGRMLGLPVIATCGGWTGHTPMVRLYERLGRMAYRLADRVITVSEATRRKVIQFGVPPQRVVAVPNAVDTERFRPGDGSALRAQLGVSPGAVLVVTVGRLSPEKGHEHLVRAVGSQRDRSGIRLVLVGDGPERARLEQLVADQRLTGAVTFAGWRDDVAEFYHAADIIALPSLMEGLPNAMLEAMACGKPVVATDVGGVAEALGDTGLVVPPGNTAAFAQALTRLVDDPGLARALGERARDRAAGMTFESNARRFEQVYAEALAGRHRGAER